MAIFSVIGVGLTGIGPLYGGWIAMNPRLGWRWCQWIQLILCGLYFASLILGMWETRASVLLTRIAKKMREETGDPRYRSRAEDEKGIARSSVYRASGDKHDVMDWTGVGYRVLYRSLYIQRISNPSWLQRGPDRYRNPPWFRHKLVPRKTVPVRRSHLTHPMNLPGC
ncbi:hypothetical protein H0H93_006779 [Arthromyces matolae]|nr:hypothetical protein H0H93_006779 [Arthromyces matolae]